MALLVRWLLLCAGKLCENSADVTAMALREQVGLAAYTPACLVRQGSHSATIDLLTPR
jgi:hypothetical protein